MYKFTKINGVTTVRSKDGGTVVSSNGFWYSKRMVDLALEEATIENKNPFLILGGGIGWQAGYLAAQLIARNPLSNKFPRIQSVEKDLGMINHTKINQSISQYIDIIQADALEYLKESTVKNYSSIFYDLYETMLDMVYPYFDGLRNLSKLSSLVIFNVITSADLLLLINQGIRFFKTIRIYGEIFGDHKKYKMKDISLSSSNKIVLMMRDKESEHSYVRGGYIELTKNFISLPESGTLPNQYVNLYNKSLTSLML